MIPLALLAVWTTGVSADPSAGPSAVRSPIVYADVPFSGAFPVPVSPLGRSPFCQEFTCKQPITLPVTQFAVVEASSPLYVSVLPLNNKTEQIDNVCYTFFETGGTTLLFYISVVFKDGTSEQWSYSKDDVPGRLGTLRGGNPTCMFQEFAVRLACQTTFILYRCFLYGSCGQFDAAHTPGVDTVFALSAEPKHSDGCQEEHISWMKSAGYNDRGYVKLPQTLPYQCVTSLNGAPCVNAEKVPEGNAISKP